MVREFADIGPDERLFFFFFQIKIGSHKARTQIFYFLLLLCYYSLDPLWSSLRQRPTLLLNFPIAFYISQG